MGINKKTTTNKNHLISTETNQNFPSNLALKPQQTCYLRRHVEPLEKGREEWKILDENSKLHITNENRKCLMNFSLNVKRTTRANLITTQIGSDVCRAES